MNKINEIVTKFLNITVYYGDDLSITEIGELYTIPFAPSTLTEFQASVSGRYYPLIYTFQQERFRHPNSRDTDYILWRRVS